MFSDQETKIGVWYVNADELSEAASEGQSRPFRDTENGTRPGTEEAGEMHSITGDATFGRTIQ